MMNSIKTHPDLLAAQVLIYDALGMSYKNVVQEAESKEYGAFRFEMNGKRILFRVAKITPTKKGQFVTLWKREHGGPIAPLDDADPVDLVVISVRLGQRLGHFVFPTQLLVEKGVFSKHGRGGKRAIRVYPAWDAADNRQAELTQRWQLLYFFECGEKIILDENKIRRLYFHTMAQ